MATLRRTFIGIVILVFDLAFALSVAAQSQLSDLFPFTSPAPASDSGAATTRVQPPFVKPVPVTAEQQGGVDWGHLVGQSLFFMSFENAFRCATEEGTRAGFSNPFFRGYLNSVGNLHGWSDGDPFYVNYVGHPMQGAVSGYLWTQNDRRYRDIQFGQNRKYWKGKLRAAAYSYVYSVLFEIGPMSEASIGNIQAYYPEQGFVDHVVTPVIGLGWSIAEDALDQYFIRYLERHTSNNWALLLVRGGLNPARSMANVVAFRPPWHRDNRPGVRSGQLRDLEFMEAVKERNTAPMEISPPAGVAPFEFHLTANSKTYLGDGHAGPCIGGGGSGAIRLASEWQFVVDVSGCKMFGLENNLSGDSLSYLAGARWTPHTTGRWMPHAELLIGGTKLTQELVNSQIKEALKLSEPKSTPLYVTHALYAKDWETNGFTIQAGSGLELRLNNALSYRVADLEYSHSWNQHLNGVDYRNSLQFTTGLVLRMGTW
jgi:hypothetical protein